MNSVQSERSQEIKRYEVLTMVSIKIMGENVMPYSPVDWYQHSGGACLEVDGEGSSRFYRKCLWYPLDRSLGGPQSQSGCCAEAALALIFNMMIKRNIQVSQPGYISTDAVV
jgi:hypothetical protein